MIQQKIELTRKHMHEPTMKQSQLALWAKEHFCLWKTPTQGTISNILKSKDTLLQTDVSTDLSRVRAAKNPALGQALKLWVLNMENNNMPITLDIIKTKAESFSTQLHIDHGTFKFSTGWATSFCKRYSIKFTKTHGESAQADDEEILKAMHDLLAKIGEYEQRDVFNFDETGLVYCAIPKGTFSFLGYKVVSLPRSDRIYTV